MQEEHKYPEPRVLLIDLPNEVLTTLKNEGFNLFSGSFGKVYEVAQKESEYYTIPSLSQLPSNLTEIDIVIIDLSSKTIGFRPSSSPPYTIEGDPILVSSKLGVMDTRPLSMLIAQTAFDKILARGAIVIIFAEPKTTYSYYRHKPFHIDMPSTDISTWAFNSELDSDMFSLTEEQGNRIEVLDSVYADILRKHAKTTEFHCYFEGRHFLRPRFIPLALNSHDEEVAGILESQQGAILLFPHIVDKSSFLLELMTQILPSSYPDRFPYYQGNAWLKSPEYELPQVISLSLEIARLEALAKNEVSLLKERIELERTQKWYLHALLHETGDVLVTAVKMTLEQLGFNNIAEIDNELKKQGKHGTKKEDLQIRDISPLVLVEVKGVDKGAKDADALQITKNVYSLMASGKTDVRGLSIINHQRKIDPLKRTTNPFSDEVLNSSQELNFGLLTCWTLFRIIRNFKKLNWMHKQVSGLFYQNGFIECIPLHYVEVGKIEKITSDFRAIGVRLEKDILTLGDRIAVEFSVEFEEQEIESLQLNGNPIQRGEIGALVGIGTNLENVRIGLRVFRVVLDQ